jgi:hypothetical protein
MTRKEQILRFVSRQDDDVSFEKVIYHLTVMRGIEIGMEQVRRGNVIADEELDKPLNDDAQKEKARLDPPRRGQPAGDKTPHRQGSAKNGRSVRGAAKKTRE